MHYENGVGAKTAIVPLPYEGQPPPRTEAEWMRYRMEQEARRLDLDRRGMIKRPVTSAIDPRQVQEADLDPNRTAVESPALELEQVEPVKPVPNIVPVAIAGALAFMALR